MLLELFALLFAAAPSNALSSALRSSSAQQSAPAAAVAADELRHKTPTDAEQSRARQELAAELAPATTAADVAEPLRERSQRLRELALSASRGPQQRFVLLVESFEASLKGKDVEGVRGALDALQLHFTTPLHERFARALEAAKGANESANLAVLVPWGLARAAAAFEAAELEEAQALLKRLERRVHSHPQHRAQWEQLERRYGTGLELATRAQLALQLNPADPQASSELGLYHCLSRGDFQRGAPLLRLSPYAELSAVAKLECDAPQEAAAYVGLARSWMQLADGKTLTKAPWKLAALTRAAHWLESAARLAPGEGHQDQLAALSERIARLESSLSKPVAAAPAGAAQPANVRPIESSAAGAATLADALEWLARHQAESGVWSPDGFVQCCGKVGEGRCDGLGGPENRVGLSGLVLLAFLEHGSAPGAGPYGECVARGVGWLLARQDPKSGLIGGEGYAFIYNHAIATAALSEACRAAPSAELRNALELAVKFIAGARNAHGAWRYTAHPSGENDTSVTGWMVECLMRARACGVAVDRKMFEGALTWLEEATDSATGRVGYDACGTPSSRVTRVNDQFIETRGESMTAVTLWCRYLMGHTSADTPVLAKHVELLKRSRPRWDTDTWNKDGTDLYYWRAGALALHAAGGGEWSAWRSTLVAELVRHQRRDGDFKGSWDPSADPWGSYGGRIYTTALAASCLLVGSRPAPAPHAPRIVIEHQRKEDPQPPPGKPKRFPLPGEKY